MTMVFATTTTGMAFGVSAPGITRGVNRGRMGRRLMHRGRTRCCLMHGGRVIGIRVRTTGLTALMHGRGMNRVRMYATGST
jgi:hypothetical protein